MSRVLLNGSITLLLVAVAYALGSLTTDPEVVEVPVEVVKWKGTTPKTRIEWRDRIVPVECERDHVDDPKHQAQLGHLAALDAELALLTAPELAHPLTGLSLLHQVELRVVFDRMRPSHEDVLEGKADTPKAETVQMVRAVLGEAEVGRLYGVLLAEFHRYKRDYARWRIFDPLAAQLFWNISGEL